MGSSLILPIVLLIILLAFGVIFLINVNKQKNLGEEKNISTNDSKKITKGTNDVPKEDVFKFMEFDKIMDDMIVQNNGQKYTMVLKCKGINYDLMSENEQLAVEEGFITFLNTLKFPVQLYVQAQNIDLKKTISKYNEHLQGLVSEYDQANLEYNQVISSLDSTKEEIRKADYNKKSVQNVLEYASDIVRYVERLSANKSLLQRSFYVIFSYYTSEITSISNFSKQEIVDICYNELYTRAASISGALASCSVSTTLLKSNDLANLLYTSYNRDDAKYIDVERALQSGFYRLYSTSEDAFSKRQNMLDEQIKNEAQIKAYEALKKAIEDGEYVTPEMREIEINQEIAKTAIDIVRNEQFDEDVKEQAKDIIVEDYKNTKKKILENSSKKSEKKEEKKIENENLAAKIEETVENKIDENKDLTSGNKQEDRVINENVNSISNDDNNNSNNEVSKKNEKIKNEEKLDNNLENEISKESVNNESKEKISEISENLDINDYSINAEVNKNDNEKKTEDSNNNDDGFEDDFFDSII